ncbi:MAG: hypothetical protein KGL39_10790 [Patescibacteria group bacterium]|nr:hypothetical protein [Patescibacteria group bacterium]
MPHDSFKRVQHGDLYLAPRSVNAPQEVLEKMQEFSCEGGGRSFGNPNTPKMPREMILAKIISADSSTPVKYSWSRMLTPQTDQTKETCDPWYNDVEGGPTSESGLYPAYEINSNAFVPVGAVVELWPSEAGQCWFFIWPTGALVEQVFTESVTIIPGGPTPGSIALAGEALAVDLGVALAVWGGIDCQGPLTITPMPTTRDIYVTYPPLNVGIQYTYVVVGVVNLTRTAISLVGTLTTTDPNTTFDLTFPITPGVRTYEIIRTSQTPGRVSVTLYDPIERTATTTDSDGNELVTTVTGPRTTPPLTIGFVPAKPPPTTADPPGTVVGTLTTTDPNPGQQFTYILTGPLSRDFTVTGTGQLVLTGPITAPGPVTVGVQVTDTLGIVVTQDVTVTVTDPSSPGITLTPAQPPPTTASPANTVVGTLTTSDPNPGQTFTYLLTGPNTTDFTVTGDGQLVLTGPITTPGPITVGVQVTDSLGLTLTQDVTVTVYQPITTLVWQPADPPPTTSSPANTVVGTLTTTDPNPGSVPFTYTVTSPNYKQFAIDSSGTLTLAQQVTAAGAQTVTAQVTDALGLTVATEFQVVIVAPGDTTTKPPPVVVTGGDGTTIPTITVAVPINDPVDPRIPPPSGDGTGILVTTTTSNSILSVPIQAPTATTAAPAPGSSSVTIKVTVKTPLGESLPSPAATITNAPATISPSAPLSITITPPVNAPDFKTPALQYGLYLTGGTVTNPTGFLGVVGPFTTPGPQTVTYTGWLPLGWMPSAPPSSNTTALSTIPTATGLNILPLSTPAAPAVNPLATGASMVGYQVVANDGWGSTDASPTTTITNSAASPNNSITWQPVPGALSYDIYRPTGGSTQGKLGTVYAGQPLVFVDANVGGDSSTAPASNTTGKLLVDGVPVSTGGGMSKTLIPYFGNTASTSTTVFDVTDASGIGGEFSIKNTDASHSLDFTVTVKDFYGFSSNYTSTITPGVKAGQAFDDGTNFSNCYPPYQEIKLEVIDHVGGNHAAYSVYKMQF